MINLNQFDFSKLTPNSQEIIQNQPTIVVGTIGNSSSGKSTLIRNLTGINPIKHSIEEQRNITIKLGYANTKIYRCPTCPRPDCYGSFPSTTFENPIHAKCNTPMELIRHISFVDCPGHELLMATMLTGASVMDSAFLLIAANETCPQPQTAEHFAAIQMMELENIFVLQSKMDLIKKERATESKDEVKQFLKGTLFEKAPIIPISAIQKMNMDVICDYLCSFIPTPVRDFTSSPIMTIIRSFDINLPGSHWDGIKGGVAGGTLTKGMLKLGDEIEIRPGVMEKDPKGRVKCTPIRTRIVSLFSYLNPLQFAVPGGLIGVGTKVDPILCKEDRLVGQVLGAAGELPEIYSEIEISFHLLRNLLGVRSEEGRESKVSRLKPNEVLLLNIGPSSCGAKIIAVKSKKETGGKNMAKISLNHPVCSEIGEKLTLSRRIDKHWRLIGWGTINRGTVIVPQDSI